MRQQSQSPFLSQSVFSQQSIESRKKRMDKNRAIRKNKVTSSNEQPSAPTLDKKGFTKQQKLQLQKAKNREAAQKSRDEHKKYVQVLEEQNKHLKQQLAKPRMCSKCARQLHSDTEQSSYHSTLIFQTGREYEPILENQNNHDFQEFEKGSSFQRIHDFEESSPLKMFLFISMIVLGVFIMNFGSESILPGGNSAIKRDLMQMISQNKLFTENSNQIYFPSKSSKKLQQIKKFDLRNSIQNSFNMDDQYFDKNSNSLAQIVHESYELSALNQQNCIKSIIDKNYTNHKQFQYGDPIYQDSKISSFLRSNPTNEMSVFKPQPQQKQSVLFCSLPKIYRKNNEVERGFLSNIIDIIISGSEMMQILGTSPNLWMNKMVNFNGLYKINAEVKEIVKIEDNNCIL